MTDGGKVGVDVIPDFSGFGSLFTRGIRGALTQAQSLGKEAGKTLGGGIQAGVALGVAGAGLAIADFVAHGIKDFSRLADQTRGLQRLTGASAESASLFASTIAHMGVDVDGASRGLGIFGAHIAEQPQLFAKYGVAIAKTSSGNNDLLGTLDNLRKSFVGTADASTRDAAAKALLGRSYQTLLPYLTATDDRLALFQRLARNSGQVLSQADVDKARDLKVQLQEAKDVIENLKVSAGRFGAGILGNVADNITVLSKTGIGDIGRVLGAKLGLTDLPKHIQDAVDKQHGLRTATAEAEVSLQEQALAAEKDGTALTGMAAAAEGVRSAQQGVHSAEEALASASRGVETARRGVTTANENAEKAAKDLTKAEADLQKLEAAGPVDAKAVADARRNLDSANRSARDSAEALAAAEDHLAQVEQGASTDDLANANLRLRQADIALKEAKLAQAQPGSSTDPYAAAQAKLNVDQAVQARREAAEQLTKVQEQGTASDQNLIDAQKAVRDARERNTDAIAAEADAQQKLTEAEAGDPDFQQKLADAKDRVADATRGVRDAQQGEADAAQAVRDAQQQVVDAHAALEDANYKLRDAQHALGDAFDKAGTDGANLSKVLDDLKQKYPELAGIIQQFYAEIPPPAQSGPPPVAYREDNPNFIGPLPSRSPVYRDQVPNFIGPVASRPPGRAGGGPVMPGQMYRINENTANSELVEFGQPGHVYTPDQAAARAGGSDQPIVIHTHLILDSREIGVSTSRHMRSDTKARG